MKIKTTFLYLDKENSNERIYTKELGCKIIDQFKNILQNGIGCFGELNCDINGPWNAIMLTNVSHTVEDISFNASDNCIEGTINLLNTPKGNQIMDMLKENNLNFDDCFVVRPRGFGTLNKETKEVENYELVSFDIITKGEDSFTSFYELNNK